MLGFAPAAPVSALRNFTFVTASLVGASTLTFTSTASLGIYSFLEGSTSLTFAPSGIMSTVQEVAGDSPFTFNVSGKITVAGKPIIVSALPDSFTIRANLDRMETSAVAVNYITEGWQ